MKKVYCIFMGLLAAALLFMAAARLFGFPDVAIRVSGVLFLVCIPGVTYTAIRMRKEQTVDKK